MGEPVDHLFPSILIQLGSVLLKGGQCVFDAFGERCLYRLRLTRRVPAQGRHRVTLAGGITVLSGYVAIEELIGAQPGAVGQRRIASACNQRQDLQRTLEFGTQ